MARARVPVPRTALSVEEACESLGVGWDLWKASIEPEIKLVRLGRRKLVPVSELEAWLVEHAERTLREGAHG
jgi:excisionase family DNA binding protein